MIEKAFYLSLLFFCKINFLNNKIDEWASLSEVSSLAKFIFNNFTKKKK